MEIELVEAQENDITNIWEMQKVSFRELLNRYEDYDTSPACESEEKIRQRFSQKETSYYMIREKEENVGGVRVVDCGERVYRISPVFILPEHQNKGIAQKTFALLEAQRPDAVKWKLETIKQEERNCHVYEKLGYSRTGKEEHINDKMTLVEYEKIMYSR